ncbi:HNH/ENDO VII family nuclease [Bartonella sp. 220]|uniref:HNH/ENDO VII family nuclease n=1 Tax=Bartonella sp. 220B TaxID=2967260 RepID=UPI0022A8DCCA|nr:HNH/ENDO VII family nuclease [Bartonella sp. 220B]MCZ2159232.1 HNH/ENDO VII family nuclease [Bartonella sp. 220B]
MKWIKKKIIAATEFMEFKGQKVYQGDELFEPEAVSSWKEKGQIVAGTNVERMKSGRAPIGVDSRPVMLYPIKQEQDTHLVEILYSFYRGKSVVAYTKPKTNFIKKVICWISKKGF